MLVPYLAHLRLIDILDIFEIITFTVDIHAAPHISSIISPSIDYTKMSRSLATPSSKYRLTIMAATVGDNARQRSCRRHQCLLYQFLISLV